MSLWHLTNRQVIDILNDPTGRINASCMSGTAPFEMKFNRDNAEALLRATLAVEVVDKITEILDNRTDGNDEECADCLNKIEQVLYETYYNK